MPPRRSARVAAVAERESSALPPLPLSLALAVFSLLPVDARLRCREVCRGWRAVLLERSLWLRLDLSEASGDLALPATDALLRAAAMPAGGQLHFLDVSECEGITHPCLLALLAANAGALRELRAWTAKHVKPTGFAHVEALRRAAPQLRVFDADVTCESLSAAQSMLRNEGAWAPLRLRKLQVLFDARTEAAVLSLALDLAAHSSLVNVYLDHAPLDTLAALDAIVAVALAKRFSTLAFFDCHLSPASAPALARLLGGGALRILVIANRNAPLLDAAAATVLADALRANRTLHELVLLNSALWHDPVVALTLLGAVTAHRSLPQVSIYGDPVGDAQDAAGAALGALVAANAAALSDLDLSDCGLQEAALGPLFDALPANTHLETLMLGEVTASAAFLRDRLLPAVRANTSLTSLDIAVVGEGESEAREAEEIVNSHAAR
jgi:hypothetical protein